MQEPFRRGEPDLFIPVSPAREPVLAKKTALTGAILLRENPDCGIFAGKTRSFPQYFIR
jgi:hypothetical protein